MWTHRRFTWRYTCDRPEQALALAGQVKAVVEDLMVATPQFYRDGSITGMAYGMLEFALTVSDRDQWWVARRARFLVDELRKRTELPLNLVSEERVKLAPHPFRGKYRLRRLRREAQGG